MEPAIALELRNSLSADEWQQLFGWGKDLFGLDAYGYQWAPDEDKHVLVRVDGQLACHVGIVRREVQVGAETLAVGGLGSVITLPAYRGRGLARLALERASEYMRTTLAVPFALLVCRDDLVPFYAPQGWERVDAPVYFDQPAGKVRSAAVLMVQRYGPRAWPPGAVDLRGLPF
jgi:GNAT superfamily N-acetyltransferase